MAIDYEKWLCGVASAASLADETLTEARQEFGSGFLLKTSPMDGEAGYACGQEFVDRLCAEVATVKYVVGQLSEQIIKGGDSASQFFFDDFLKRQRKLFEALILAIMLSRRSVWADDKVQWYFLHLHLVHDYEHYRRLKADLSDSFGCANTYIDSIITATEARIDELPIDVANCSWFISSSRKATDANTMFLNVRADATPLERTALGLSYRGLFGFASGQVHFNLSRFHSSSSNESDFLSAVENATLLSVCLGLRMCELLDRMSLHIGPKAMDLRARFAGALPNSFASAVLGEADEGDLVIVSKKEGCGTFVGLVIQRRERLSSQLLQYASYKVQHATGGNIDWFASTSVSRLLRSDKIEEFLQSAVEQGFIDAVDVTNLPVGVRSVSASDLERVLRLLIFLTFKMPLLVMASLSKPLAASVS